jgi:predicted ribosome quality control (RQC) complex YloA/Tae2 family protein
MAADLESLRSAPLSVAAVESILQRYRLLSPAGKTSGQLSRTTQEKTPYRTYYWNPADAPPESAGIRLLVGKSAADSDELCRQAKGNDLWVHIVGTTGSHVIIPARDLRGPPSPALLRAAAILAIHYSKHRADQSGEVYLARRQDIKKRRGMAPGLWQIMQAETLFFRYDTSELQQILALAYGASVD